MLSPSFDLQRAAHAIDLLLRTERDVIIRVERRENDVHEPKESEEYAHEGLRDLWPPQLTPVHLSVDKQTEKLSDSWENA